MTSTPHGPADHGGVLGALGGGIPAGQMVTPPDVLHAAMNPPARTLLAGKLHRIEITAADPDYEGSAGICPEIMEAAGLLPGERILIGDIRNGARWETYAFPGAEHEFSANGGAARLCAPGDLCVVMWFQTCIPWNAQPPTAVVFDDEFAGRTGLTNQHWSVKDALS